MLGNIENNVERVLQILTGINTTAGLGPSVDGVTNRSIT